MTFSPCLARIESREGLDLVGRFSRSKISALCLPLRHWRRPPRSPPADSLKMQTLKNALWFAPVYLAGLYLTIVSIDCFIKVERAIQSTKAYQHAALIQAGGR